MRRRTRRVSRKAAVGLGLGLAIVLLAPALAATSETYRDNFDAISYNGSNGSASWSGPWIETGESDGANAGRVRVSSDAECAAGTCVRMAASGSTTAGIQREADLDGAATATLSFSYQRTKAGGNAGVARVSVSSNGGGSWTTLGSYNLDASDAGQVPQSFNIVSSATSQTRVRFLVVSVPGESGRFNFDNVTISLEIPDPTTTTTSTTGPPSTTTTTLPSSTTTTLPPTTTTTSAPTTTTQAPPSTTQPPSTTAPPSTQAPPTSAPPPTTAPVFPISVAAAPPGGETSEAQDPVELVTEDPEHSDLVRLAMGDPIMEAALATTPSAASAAASNPTVDALRYALPLLLMAAIIVVISLLRGLWRIYRVRRNPV